MPICLQYQACPRLRRLLLKPAAHPIQDCLTKQWYLLGGPCDGSCGPSSFIHILFYTQTKNREIGAMTSGAILQSSYVAAGRGTGNPLSSPPLTSCGACDKECGKVSVASSPRCKQICERLLLPRLLPRLLLLLLLLQQLLQQQQQQQQQQLQQQQQQQQLLLLLLLLLLSLPCLVFHFFRLGCKVVICIMSLCYSMWGNSWSLDSDVTWRFTGCMPLVGSTKVDDMIKRFPHCFSSNTTVYK